MWSRRTAFLLAIACALTLSTQARAGTIAFTSDNGPDGWIYDGSHTKVGVFFFNITNIPGSTKSNGIDIYWQWDQGVDLIGFHVDFSGGFPVGPLSITSAQFQNEYDFSKTSDWASSFTATTASFHSNGSSDEVSNGQWWGTTIYFSDIVQGTLGFNGYLETADSAPETAPEPGTLLMAGTGMALAAFLRLRS